ncbi:hypothetical protein D3C73_750770 [compost metagenome]
MVSAFAIFCFMIDNRILYFYFTRAEVTLEVRHIILSVPETELGKREEGNRFVSIACILNS